MKAKKYSFEVNKHFKNGFFSNVSIIIPFHGQYQFVVKLIESIFQYTKSNWYEICLVDDCSPNGSLHEVQDDEKEGLIHLLSKLRSSNNQPSVKCIRSDKHIGFGAACELGYRNSSYPWTVFMNSDCEIRDINWLKNLGLSMLHLKDKGVKMIAPRTNNCVGGDLRMEIDRESYLSQIKQETSDIILDDSYLSLYCFMCHRDLFYHINGFIKHYPYGWCEDEEIAARIKKYGFKQAICKSSWIYHKGEVTVRNLWRSNQEARKIMENNTFRLQADLKQLEN